MLTEKGEDLFDLIVSLRQWGQEHAFAPDEPRSVLRRDHGRAGAPADLHHPDGGRIRARQTRVRKVGDP